MAPELLTVHQLAHHLQVKPSWIYERTRRRSADTIPHLRLGKYVRFNLAGPNFCAWLERHEVSTPEVSRKAA